MTNNTQQQITDAIYFFEEWNHGLGKKYLVTRGPSIPVVDDDGKINGYNNAPEKLTAVPR
jgi:hypothetical protein